MGNYAGMTFEDAQEQEKKDYCFSGDDDIEKCKIQLNALLKKEKRYCEYSGCLVQYFEHYHIDQHTLTFLSPEELEKFKDGK